MNHNIKKRRLLFLALLLSSVLVPLFHSDKVVAVPTITITSPTANQQIPGTNFTAAGTATPNTTVVVSNNGLSFAQTISDGSGKWSVNSSLSAGNVKITAKAIENPSYGYFVTTQDLFSNPTYAINRLRLSDNVINPDGGIWPIDATASAPLFFMPSPSQNIFYSGNFINPAVFPSRFNAALPGIPEIVSGSYPADPAAAKGDFNSDGSRYFAPNISNGTVSIINTATNEHLEDFTLDPGDGPISIWRSPQGNMHVMSSFGSNDQYVLDGTTGDLVRRIANACPTPGESPTVTFSKDSNYPYYFMPCGNDEQFIKRKISDDSVVSSININGSSGALSLDNKRLFIGATIGDDPVLATKLSVVNTESSTLTQTINLNAGAIGFLATSDFQKLYISTPGETFDTQNIDVVDTADYSVTQVATQGIPMPLTTSPTEVSEADVDVSFVLGATTPAANSGNLAETGALTISSVVLVGIILASTTYFYLDYRKHKKPLVGSNPNVHYTFAHHIRVVSIPLLRYRLTFSVSKNNDSN